MVGRPLFRLPLSSSCAVLVLVLGALVHSVHADPITQPTCTIFSASAAGISLAAAQDMVTLRITASTPIAQPNCVFSGTTRAVAYVKDLNGRQWDCRVTVDAADRNGRLGFVFSGSGINTVQSDACPDGTSVTIDTIAPVPTSVAIVSNGNIASQARTGQTVTLLITALEDIVSFSATFVGIEGTRVTTATTVGKTRQASFTVLVSDPRDFLRFSATLADRVGNQVTVSQVTGTPLLIVPDIDASAPDLQSVTTTCTNKIDPTRAREGDVITIDITAKGIINRPTITVYSSQVPATLSVSGALDKWSASYTVKRDDKQGPFAFILDYSDSFSNIGPRTNTITSGKLVSIDTQPPTITATMFSDNAVSKAAVLGNKITIFPSFSEPVATVTITVTNLISPVVLNGTTTDPTSWRATIATAVGDIEGTVTYTISAVDIAGNQAARYNGVGVVRAVCGTKVVMLGEQCDGDYRCSSNCTCIAPHFHVSPTGQGCLAGPMIAIAERKSVANPDTFIYSLELWNNAHSPPTALTPISAWLGLNTNQGTTKAGSLALHRSDGWSVCRYIPTEALNTVNINYVDVDDNSQLAGFSGLPDRLVALAVYDVDDAGLSTWKSLQVNAQNFPWAEAAGFPEAAGKFGFSSNTTQRFPNSTASDDFASDSNTFARYIIEQIGFTWPAASVAPFGTTAYPGRLSPRNQIDYFCKSSPVAASGVSTCQELRNVAPNATSSCSVSISPLATLVVRQISPSYTSTAFARNLASLLSIDVIRINVQRIRTFVKTVQVSTAPAATTARRSSLSKDTLSESTDASVAAVARVDSGRRQREFVQLQTAATTETKISAVLIEFGITQTETDPLSLATFAKLAAFVDAVDKTPLERNRLYVLDYNIEDGNLRPPAIEDSDPPQNAPNATGLSKYNYAWIAIIVIFGIIGIAVLAYCVRKSRINAKRDKEAAEADAIHEAQTNEFPFKNPGDQETPRDLPELRASTVNFKQSKTPALKMATLPILAISQKVRASIKTEAEASNFGSPSEHEDDFEFGNTYTHKSP